MLSDWIVEILSEINAVVKMNDVTSVDGMLVTFFYSMEQLIMFLFPNFDGSVCIMTVVVVSFSDVVQVAMWNEH